MAKCRKSSVPFSVESLREEAFAEGRNELIGSKILTDISSINLDQVEHVAEDVVLCALIVKFGISLVFAIAGVALSLRVLPDLVREEVLKIIFPNVDVGDLRCLYNCVQKLSKFPCFDDLDHPPHVFSPACDRCLRCQSQLQSYNRPVKIDFYHCNGAFKGVKVSLKCNRCGIYYGYSKYGNPTSGWHLYDSPRIAIEASDVCFVQRRLMEWQVSLACHSWVSFSGFSEAFNEVHDVTTGYGEKKVAAAFFNGEMENELRDLGRLDMFGLMKEDSDREKVISEIDKIRAKSVYDHPSADCSDACKERGCGRLWVVDGQWKLMFAHCMMKRKNFIRGLPLLNYPDVCTEAPQTGKAFCEEHVAYLTRKHPNVPTDLRGFLKYCGVHHSDSSSDSSDLPLEELLNKDVSSVDSVLSSLDNDEVSLLGNSAVNSQGNAEFIEKEHNAVNSILDECIEPQPTACNKETGGKQRLQKWSRGHLFIVRGGGIIDKWSPLFKSESPSQVFIIVLSWLLVILKALNPLNWSKIFVAYDNMCHLDGMRAAQHPLPWPSPWDKSWISVNKIIDSLHMSNHKDKKCKETYNPSSLKEEIPNGNTMAAEQTFVWLSRFKKILCAMPKVHHLFYLHRMVKHRNRYTVKCYRVGRKPLLPKARGKAS